MFIFSLSTHQDIWVCCQIPFIFTYSLGPGTGSSFSIRFPWTSSAISSNDILSPGALKRCFRYTTISWDSNPDLFSRANGGGCGNRTHGAKLMRLGAELPVPAKMSPGTE